MKKLLFLFLLIMVLFKSMILLNQENIMHPSKRELQAYHHEWLENPLAHGMSIEKHKSPNETPYLLVEQNKTEGRSKRQVLLRKQFGKLKVDDSSKVLVMLHGKNGRKEDLLPVAERYVALGFTCLLIDLPRHGESKIKDLYYSSKKYEQLYVDEVLDDVLKYLNIDKRYIWGISLGGAFAITSVAHSKHTFNAMVLVSTFDSLDHVLKAKSKALFGEVLGSALYEGLQFSLELFYAFDPAVVDSAKLAENLELPLYMVHGKKDELISYKQGQKLFNRFASKEKIFYLDKEGDHHNILVTKHEFFKESGAFLLTH